MNNTYGFIVKPEEKLNPDLYNSTLEEGIKGTLFVEVELNTPAFPKLAYCSFYYARHMATTNIITLEELGKRFPKSNIIKDAGEEYNKAFNIK